MSKRVSRRPRVASKIHRGPIKPIDKRKLLSVFDDLMKNADEDIRILLREEVELLRDYLHRKQRLRPIRPKFTNCGIVKSEAPHLRRIDPHTAAEARSWPRRAS
jgi:hypothetical protein